MKSKTILAGAAIAGLMSGSFAVQAHAANVTSKAGVSLSQMGAKKDKKDVHSCKGENSCKGQRRLQNRRQRLQRQEFLQRKRRLRDRRQPPVGQPCDRKTKPSAHWARVGESEFHPPTLLVTSNMPANPFNNFNEYGIGIGLRVPHYRHILEKKPVVDWFEIISENFMVDGGRPLEVLDQILEQYRVVQHGVAMYFGSADRLSREHLKKIKRLVKRTNTPWLSDHLCWGSVDGRYTHDLLPMPYTFAAAKTTADNIREASDFLEVPICVENVSSYAEFHASEMTEWEFSPKWSSAPTAESCST